MVSINCVVGLLILVVINSVVLFVSADTATGNKKQNKADKKKDQENVELPKINLDKYVDIFCIFKMSVT